MKQFFVLGASIAYGVGAETTGWGDLVKQYVNGCAYGKDGKGEVAEVYNFAKPGEGIEFVQSTLPGQLTSYSRDGEKVAIINVGGNNLKAINMADNFVSTPKNFSLQMEALLVELKSICVEVIVVGYPPFNEAVTMPKLNPLTGDYSFFTNKRRSSFNDILRRLTNELNMTFILPDSSIEEWVKQYIYKDGIHPNQAGHELIFELIKPHIKI